MTFWRIEKGYKLSLSPNVVRNYEVIWLNTYNSETSLSLNWSALLLLQRNRGRSRAWRVPHWLKSPLKLQLRLDKELLIEQFVLTSPAVPLTPLFDTTHHCSQKNTYRHKSSSNLLRAQATGLFFPRLSTLLWTLQKCWRTKNEKARIFSEVALTETRWVICFTGLRTMARWKAPLRARRWSKWQT